MKVRRGDVVLVVFPFSSGTGSKKRPALIIQNDVANQRISNTIVAMITRTTHRASLPTQVLIDVGTPEGRQSGLLATSVVACENLLTIEQGRVGKRIGVLPQTLMQQVNAALTHSLALS